MLPSLRVVHERTGDYALFCAGIANAGGMGDGLPFFVSQLYGFLIYPALGLMIGTIWWRGAISSGTR